MAHNVITFDDARKVGAASKSVRRYWGEYTVANHGWQNDDVYVLAYEPIDPAVVALRRARTAGR